MSKDNQLHYQISGKENAPLILFLHGFMGNGNDWGEVASAFETDYRCLLVDLPGHGKSLGVDDDCYRMEECAELLIHLLDKSRTDRCNVVAYSMGGRLAFFLATHYPDRFDRIIIESSTPGLKTDEERAQRRAHDDELATRLQEERLPTFLNFWYDQPIFASLHVHPQLLGQLRTRRVENDKEGLARSLRRMGTGSMPSLWSELTKIQSDLCLIAGEKDIKFSRIARELTAFCSKAEFVAVPGCGHNIHLENSKAFIQIAKQFFVDK